MKKFSKLLSNDWSNRAEDGANLQVLFVSPSSGICYELVAGASASVNDQLDRLDDTTLKIIEAIRRYPHEVLGVIQRRPGS